jgi:hypothetical protein
VSKSVSITAAEYRRESENGGPASSDGIVNHHDVALRTDFKNQLAVITAADQFIEWVLGFRVDT